MVLVAKTIAPRDTATRPIPAFVIAAAIEVAEFELLTPGVQSTPEVSLLLPMVIYGASCPPVKYLALTVMLVLLLTKV